MERRDRNRTHATTTCGGRGLVLPGLVLQRARGFDGKILGAAVNSGGHLVDRCEFVIADIEPSHPRMPRWSSTTASGLAVRPVWTPRPAYGDGVSITSR